MVETAQNIKKSVEEGKIEGIIDKARFSCTSLNKFGSSEVILGCLNFNLSCGQVSTRAHNKFFSHNSFV